MACNNEGDKAFARRVIEKRKLCYIQVGSDRFKRKSGLLLYLCECVILFGLAPNYGVVRWSYVCKTLQHQVY